MPLFPSRKRNEGYVSFLWDGAGSHELFQEKYSGFWKSSGIVRAFLLLRVLSPCEALTQVLLIVLPGVLDLVLLLRQVDAFGRLVSRGAAGRFSEPVPRYALTRLLDPRRTQHLPEVEKSLYLYTTPLHNGCNLIQ